MSVFRWIVILLAVTPLGATAATRAGGGDGASPFELRQRLLRQTGVGTAAGRRIGVADLPAVVRDRLAAGAPAISPPNVRANDPAQDLHRDTQAQVSIAAWEDYVVAIWLDAKVDDQGYLSQSSTGYAYSCDNGATFTAGGLMPLPAFDDIINWGELTVDGQGNFYAALNMNHGLASGNPLGFSADAHTVWKGRFTGCSFAWDAPVEITQEPADTLRRLYLPSIVADPYDGTLYAAFSRHVAVFTNQMEVSISRDGGATWSQPPIVIQDPQSGFDPENPRLAVGPDHEVYIVWSGNPLFAFMNCDNSHLGQTDNILFTRSLDHGLTWRSSSTIAPEYPNRWTTPPGDYRGRDYEVPSIAVDRSIGPRRGTVFVAWTEAAQWEIDPPGTDTLPEAEPNDLPIVASSFSFATAGKGTMASLADADYWKIDLQAGSDVLIFLEPDDWACIGVNVSRYIFQLMMYPEPEHMDQPADTLLAGSSIQHAPNRIVFSCKRSGTYYFKVALVDPAEAVDVGYSLSAHRIHFLPPTFGMAARDEKDVVIVRSTDQGTSWSEKSLVNWDAPAGYSESQPILTVDDTGALAAFWYDRRQTEAPDSPVNHGLLTDIYMAQSTDGVSFSPARRVTDESSTFVGAPTFNWTFGDFQGVFAQGRDLYVGWTDGRGSNAAGSGVDAYTNRVVRPRADVDASLIRFPSSTEGDTVRAVVQLRNSGAVPLHVASITVPFSRMTVTPNPPFDVPVDATVPLQFDVSPITASDSVGTIAIGSSDPFQSTQSVPVIARPRKLGFQIVSQEFFREPVVVENQDVPVIVVMDDSVHFDSVIAYYRRGGATPFSSVPLEPVASSGGGARYRAFIPTDAVGPSGFEFYVAAKNGEIESARPDPIDPIRFQVRVGDLSLPAQTPMAYRMISVPLDCAAAPLMDLLRDDLGGADSHRWRIYALASSSSGTTQYRELGVDDTTRVRQGDAYWLITRDAPALDIAPAVGVSTPTSADYHITLSRTWNMIASPFDFIVAWADVAVDGTPSAGQDVVEGPVRWNPDRGVYEPAGELKPFEGYFVKRNGNADVVLTIPPREAAGAAATAKPDRSSGERAGWDLTLRLSGEGETDVLRVGVASDARSGRDSRDASHPPSTPGGGVVLAVPHRDWKDYDGLYRCDFREPVNDAGTVAVGHSWPLSVARETPDRPAWTEMTLTVEGLERLPSRMRVVLVDDRLDRTVDLTTSPRYRFALQSSPASFEPRFRLLVGNAPFVDRGAAAPHTALADGLSEAAPNPFQTSTLLRFTVAAPGPVDLAIFDAQGRRLETLVHGPTSPGTYEIVWTGSTDAGRSVGPGLYFARLSASGLTQTRKLLRVR